MSTATYTHVYVDSLHESHMEDVEIELAEASYAPPAPPLGVSAFFPAAEYHFITMPPDWYGDWHPVPRRQLMIFLRGECEAETSDGTRRAFRPGDVVLLEDTSGRGHRSWVVGDERLLMAVVELAR